MNRALGVLLVGFGGEGGQDHQAAMYAPAFAAHPRFHLVGAADSAHTTAAMRQHAREEARAYQVPYLDDLDRALSRSDIDAVSVCAPFEDRVKAATSALDTGHHVLLDKPATVTAADSRAIAAAAAAADRICMPAHHQRFHPALRSARTSITAGRIGLPWNVQADFLVPGDSVWPRGELLNFAPYPIDAVRTLVRLEVTSVWASTGTNFHESPAADDFALLACRHQRGLTSTLAIGRTACSATYAPALTQRYRLSGSHGTMLVDTARPSLTIGAGSARPRWTGNSTVALMLDDLAAAAVERRPAHPDMSDAVAALAVIEAAQTSATTGAWEPVTDHHNGGVR